MTVLHRIINLLSDILDLDPETVSAESYLVRDLNAESIDLLEIAVMLNSEFKTDIDDDEIFLKNMRVYLEDSGDSMDERCETLALKYPFLTDERIKDMVSDLDGGPVLKVKDLVSYITYKAGENEHAIL